MNTVRSHFSLPVGITESCHVIFGYFFLREDLVDFCPSGSVWQCFVPTWTWRVVLLSCNQLCFSSLENSTQVFNLVLLA